MDRRYRNTLFEAIKDVGLEGCVLSHAESKAWYGRLFGGDTVVIHHPLTGSSFAVSKAGSQSGKGYSVSWSVTDGPQMKFALVVDLDETVQQVRPWAKETKYVAENPDLWVQARQAAQVLTQAPDNNTPFSADEQAEVSRRIDEVKQLVREKFDLADEKLAAIDQRLDDAKEAAKTTGRKTWLYTFYGAVMSTLMTDEIPPHVVQAILATVVHGIGHLFGVGSPPPVITA